jgi:hypothetical protein
VLLDLESANTFLAGIDLAFLFATFWTPPQRRRHERKCLERYHAGLCAHGVRGFSFSELVHDYRVAIAMMIFYPIWDAIGGKSSRAYWWPKMQCLMAAYDELDCRELTR